MADAETPAEASVNLAAAQLFSDLGVVVEARNEARVHLWYEQEFGVLGKRFESSCDAIDHLPRQRAASRSPAEGAARLDIYAPHGVIAFVPTRYSHRGRSMRPKWLVGLRSGHF